jgi:hypothetical protein
MTAEQANLKPCPCCGGGVKLEEVKMRSGTWYGIKCRNNRNLGGDCAIEQVPSRTPEAAISRWNMRKPEDELRAEIERLNGLRPDAPPRAPDGGGLPRYGLRWNGPQQPLAVPMDDGYWTPWHLAERIGVQLDVSEDTLATIRGCLRSAEEEIDQLKAELEALRKDAERYRWLSQVSTMADKLSPGTVDHAIMLHQTMERIEIPDFTPGNGNKARRRAEELGIDYDAAIRTEHEHRLKNAVTYGTTHPEMFNPSGEAKEAGNGDQ